MIEKIRTPLGRRAKRRKQIGGKGGRRGAGKKCTFKRTHFLPYEDVVDHGASAKHDAEADEDRRDDRRGRMELDERVQDHACEFKYRYYHDLFHRVLRVILELWLHGSSTARTL